MGGVECYWLVVWYKVVELGTRTEVVAADALMLRYVEGVRGMQHWRGRLL